MSRIGWLDAVRVFAIFLVVLTHSHEQTIIKDVLPVSILYTIDRLGVPLFFMISGGLLLPKIVNVDIFKFYKKRVIQFLFLLVFYSIITNTIKLSLDGGGFINSLYTSIINYNAITNTGPPLGEYGHARQLWFMFAIIQLYLVAPFLAKLLHHTKTKDIIIFLALCVLLNATKLTVNNLWYHSNFWYRLGTDFTGSYITYFIFGYLVIDRFKHLPPFDLKTIIISLCALIIPSVFLIYQDVDANKINNEMHWYNTSLFILISSFGLMMLLRGALWSVNCKACKTLSLYSFGIFLVHYIYIYCAKALLQSFELSLPATLNVIFLLVFSLFMSIVTVHFLIKTRFTAYLVS